MAQLPAEARGTAAAVLAFSLISEVAGLLLIWLVWTHRERTSYVALIAYFTWIATTTSVIQQIHLYAGLFLALSMYGRTVIVADALGKIAAILVPIIFICLLQIDAIKSSFMGFLVLADLPLLISLVGGCIFVGAIIRKYIQTRRQFRASSMGYHRWDFGESRIYDRWLLIRFSAGFFILALFNMTNIICQVAWQANTSRDTLSASAGPDRSAARARHDSALFLPGVSSSLLAFVIFGTTAPFRKHMRETFSVWRRCSRPPDINSPLPPQLATEAAYRKSRLSGGGGGGGERVGSGYYEVTVYGPQGRRTTSISYAGGMPHSIAAAAAGGEEGVPDEETAGRMSAFFHASREPEPVYDGRRHHHHRHHPHQHHYRSNSAGWS
ncbi:hypothetical protein SLS62_007719 [Diatrype stigma]|uniref:Uncharacterized protein n=1 Tax=Diatrype stigma TaxID=117547 RepID=A0AAN9UP73_9PEZI